jgi:hypothetical protein
MLGAAGREVGSDLAFGEGVEIGLGTEAGIDRDLGRLADGSSSSTRAVKVPILPSRIPLQLSLGGRQEIRVTARASSSRSCQSRSPEDDHEGGPFARLRTCFAEKV